MDADEVRLKDLKARKGHLCLGGSWSSGAEPGVPLCGCGVRLDTEPDFMAPPPAPVDEGSYYAPTVVDPPDDDPPPPFRHANGEPCYGCQSCLADAELPPWEDDPDALERIGKDVTDAHGSGEVDMRPALPTLDPTQPFGPAEIDARILEANARLERGAVHEANLVAAAEHLGIEYKLAFARALRDSTGGAADVRKAEATLATEREYRAWMDAVGAMKAMQSITHTLRSTLSGYQSVGRSVGAAYNSTRGVGR